ncbi:hypothetical protein EST38_g12720 [Candolleomyces aberdarensis]|uniref:DUF8191 domain-containing protein n=1 Tax=Candolleomyces aberdarensis TaxID=2316362 RepID=A0A4Q2D476_9AGAR|nr:hypothetical protein EST38_g12720 [Candolleomyces aberdarensis]
MEYQQLRQRGATHLMCETFNLGSTEDEGIFAWANEYLFGEFSSDAVMGEGDEWKIYLGRRIELEEEDVDGEGFIEGLLEDGVLFAPEESRWTTVKEGPNLWVTRPNLTETPGTAEAGPWPVMSTYEMDDNYESENGSDCSVRSDEETDNEGLDVQDEDTTDSEEDESSDE